MKPGIVLISLTTSEPSGITKKSTRARPSQPIASKARAASSRSSAATSSGQVGRDVELGVLLGEVLRREVVELVLAADPDLGRHAGLRACRPAPASTPHSTSRAPSAAASTSTFGSCRQRLLDGRVELGGVVRLGDADARAAAGGLHEQREAERRRRGRGTPSGSRSHSRAVTVTDGITGSPAACEHDLHVGLVHADRGGEHAGADVADAGHLEHPLDGAVLAPRPVQQREDDVDLAERAAAAATARGRPGRSRRRLADQGDRGAVAVDAGQLVGALDPQPLGVAGLQHPAAVGGDADRHHVVRRRGRSPRARCRR